MPGPLANQKYEKFAQLVAGGMTKKEAFLQARDPKKPPLKTDGSIRQSATNLMKIPAVKARIAELQERVVQVKLDVVRKTEEKAANLASAMRKRTEIAAKALEEIVQDSTAPASARVSAAIAILERGWGKPAQSVDMTVRRADPERYSDADLASYLEAVCGVDIAAQTNDPAVVH